MYLESLFDQAQKVIASVPMVGMGNMLLFRYDAYALMYVYIVTISFADISNKKRLLKTY